MPAMRFRGKVKLHGTHAALEINDGRCIPWSRSQALIDTDNFGFATWAKGLTVQPFTNGILYGEWFGPGVQSGVACSQIPNKTFAVYALFIDGEFFVEPAEICAWLQANFLKFDIIPWQTEEIELLLSDEVSVASAAEQITPLVNEVEREDPFIRDNYPVGPNIIRGTGEGLVFYPSPFNPDWMFKAKGLKHQVKASKEVVATAPEVVASVDEFVKIFVTENRCKHGTESFPLDKRNTGKFVGWIVADVKKESEDELAVSGLTWPQVDRAIQDSARKWFLGKC